MKKWYVLLIFLLIISLWTSVYGDRLIKEPSVSADSMSTSRIVSCEDGTVQIHMSAANPVIPGKWVNEDQVDRAVNNVDVVKFEKEYHIAIRTAPTHFQSKKAEVRLYRSFDSMKTLQLMKVVHTGHDLREPRFVIRDHNLELYTSEIKPIWQSLLEPERVLRLRFEQDQGWGEPATEFETTWIPWRGREFQGRSYLSMTDVGDISGKNKSSPIRLLVSEHGGSWQLIDGMSMLPNVFGASRASQFEYVFDQKGNMWALVRSELEGSYTMYIPADASEQRRIVFNDHRYDEATMFQSHGKIFVVARRNLQGEVDQLQYGPEIVQNFINMLKYTWGPKRTALYEFNTKTLSIDFLVDLPSHGDTSSAAVTEIGDSRFLVLYYSSPLEKIGWDYPWLKGQLNQTLLYSLELRIS